MGKAKRIKQRRPSPSTRRTVVIDACMIGHLDGMLTARVAESQADSPVNLAVPANTAASLVERLRLASIDTEENYWQVTRHALHGTTPGDGDAASAAIRKFLLKQNWQSVIARVPASPEQIFLVSHVGHVGLVAPPPFTDQRSLLIFDPMQLRRLGPALQTAIANAHADPTAGAVTPAAVAAVVDFLKAEPWETDHHPEPSFEQARAEMQKRYRAFLTREPYVRPDEHNVPEVAQ
ncbi:hypothetical protein [Virgisporangium aurantiacum]|uniref:hypothetical protein n=1 Tax=Virgisporangium aurantiacum TaxID=175570 RepID=UPI001951E145|nr:hypothetical protein [Virgisporangium aurantiacum]